MCASNLTKLFPEILFRNIFQQKKSVTPFSNPNFTEIWYFEIVIQKMVKIMHILLVKYLAQNVYF